MGFFSYFNNIPFATNNPSVDQPNMETDTNAISGLIAIDHIGFNQNNGGLHNQVSLYLCNGSPGSIPTTIGANIGCLYTKQDSLTRTQLFYTNGTTTNEYQMTRVIPGTPFNNFFAQSNHYQNASGAVPDLFGGWTFLPGGLLLQYGLVQNMPFTDAIVLFPIPFTNIPFSITATAIVTGVPTTPRSVAVQDTTVTNSQFNADTGTTSGFVTQFYWMAIGV